MLAIAAMAAMRASTMATMMSGERPAVVDLMLVTSVCTPLTLDCTPLTPVCRLAMLVCMVPKFVLIVAVSPEMLVTVPVIVPKSVLIVAVSPEMLVTVVPIELSEVVIVPSEVVMFTFWPATAPRTALRLSSLVWIVPTLVVTVASPLLMLVIEPLMPEMLLLMPEMLLLMPETDDDTPWMLVFNVPMEVLRVAVLPFTAINVALRAFRVVWTDPTLVVRVTTLPWIAATVALSLLRFELRPARVVLRSVVDASAVTWKVPFNADAPTVVVQAHVPVAASLESV